MGFATHLGPFRLGTVKEGAAANCGVNVVSQSATITNADTAVKNLFILPAGAQVISIYIDVITAFNSSGTDLLSVGKTGSNTFFVNGQDVSTTGHLVGTLVPGNLATIFNVGTVDVQVVGIYVQSVGDSTTGSARVTCVYAVKDANGNENPTSV